MPFETTYVVDEQMQMRSVRQMFGVTLGARLLILMALSVLACVLAMLLPRTFVSGLYIGLVIGMVLATLIVAVQVLRTYRRMGRDFLSLDDDHTIKIVMDEEAIDIRQVAASRRIPWNRVTKVLNTRDFVMLLHGTVLLAMLSKPHLGEEGQAFLRQRQTLYGPATRP
jgi:hypothetical protein